MRNLPGHPYLRASVGAWNDESDLERLLAALVKVRLRLLRVEPRLGPGLPEATQRARADARGARVRGGLRRRPVGLMGLLADAALEAGGEVVGVIPQQLVDREIAHRGLTELHVVARRCTSARR